MWLQRFLAFVRETWTSLDPEELDLFVVHISVSSPPRAVPHCVLLVCPASLAMGAVRLQIVYGLSALC